MDDQTQPGEPGNGTHSRNDDTKRTRKSDPEDAREGDTDSDSVIDLAQQPIVKAWTTYLTLLLALVATGFGLFGILSDAIGVEIVDTPGGIAGFDVAFEAAFSVPLTATPYLAILTAVFVGAFLGWQLERDRSTTYVVAGVGMGVATFVFWVLAALFGSIPLDTVALNIGGLFINAIVAGITAGLVAAGGVWATRTRAPISHLERDRV